MHDCKKVFTSISVHIQNFVLTKLSGKRDASAGVCLLNIQATSPNHKIPKQGQKRGMSQASETRKDSKYEQS